MVGQENQKKKIDKSPHEQWGGWRKGGEPMNISAKWKEMRKIIAVCSHYYLFAFVFASFILAICSTMHVVTIYVRVRERERAESATDSKQYEFSHNCITIEKQTGWIELRNPRQWHEAKIVHRFERLIKSYIEHITYLLMLMVVAGQFSLILVYVHFVHKNHSTLSLRLGSAKRRVLAGCCFHLCDKQLQKWSKAITIALKYKLNER